MDPLQPLVTTHAYVVGVELRESGSSHACCATVSTPSATTRKGREARPTQGQERTRAGEGREACSGRTLAT